MKNWLLICILCTLYGAASGQVVRSADSNSDTKEKSSGKSRSMLESGVKEEGSTVMEQVYRKESRAWYLQQAGIWRQTVEDDKSNAEAWLNYYKASSYAKEEQETLDQIVSAMNVHIPNTFQVHYVNYLHGGRDLSKGTELMKAYLLDPGRKELYKELAVYFELKGDRDNFNNTVRKWPSAGEMPQELMDYASNLLNTPVAGSLLILDGEYDTYPLWILQVTGNMRQDVKVINLGLMENSAYRSRICKENGLNCPDFSSKAAFITGLARNNPSQKLYISLTVNPSYLEEISDHLYNEGLAYRYAATSYNHTQRLAGNWEMVYKTASLGRQMKGNAFFTASKLNQVNLNYVASGLELYDSYRENGETAKAEKLLSLLTALAKAAGKEELVRNYISD